MGYSNGGQYLKVFCRNTGSEAITLMRPSDYFLSADLRLVRATKGRKENNIISDGPYFFGKSNALKVLPGQTTESQVTLDTSKLQSGHYSAIFRYDDSHLDEDILKKVGKVQSVGMAGPYFASVEVKANGSWIITKFGNKK